MKTTPAALALLLAVAPAGCGAPEKLRALVAPKPTPAPTAAPAPTPVPPPPLAMDFVKVREERARGSAGPAACSVDIALGGAKREEIAEARVVVKTAVDDLGTSLLPDGAASPAFAPLPAGGPDAPVVLSVPMKVAARKATSLREVSGEIELYVPGGDPKAPPSAAGLDPKSLPPGTVRRYRFSLKDVPLP